MSTRFGGLEETSLTMAPVVTVLRSPGAHSVIYEPRVGCSVTVCSEKSMGLRDLRWVMGK